MTSDKFTVKPQQVGLLCRTHPTSRWLTAAANSRSASAARSRMPSGRPTDRRHTSTSGVSSGPLGAAYRSAHSSTSRAGSEASPGVQVGDSIMTAGNSHTAHSRAILAEHRPMPCYGVVNASMITDKAAPVVQAQGIRTPSGSKCLPSDASDTEASSCVPPRRKQVLTYS